MSGHRTFLGSGVFTTDNGRTADPFRLRGILHDAHALRSRADENRYSMSNTSFVQFVERIVEEGPVPSPILIRKRGLLTAKDLEFKHLKQNYTDSMKAAEEPVLETVYGNRRLYGLIEAMKIWDKNPKVRERVMGEDPIRLIAMHRRMTDEEAEAEFVDENSNRAKTSIYEDHLTVRARLKRNQTWGEIAHRLRMPEKELRRIHNPLTEAHLAVVLAFSEGSITRHELMQIAKLDMLKQAEALENPSMVPKAAPRKQAPKPAQMPMAELIDIANHCSNGGPTISRKAGVVLEWLKGMNQAQGGAR
jgi:hypothetical protein